MKPMRGGRKRPSMRIKHKLVEVELLPRKSRHNKLVVMARDYDPLTMSSDEVGVRRTNTLRVANGPTQKKGLLNLPPASPEKHKPDVYADQRPGWWKEGS